ncbi:serine hydrolase [Bowmanella pacifica]|uniref:Hydrolase n=1 Tax=Bowmanella pacifica TaxID=502051 RepID=A0A917YR35_9ALTE|nr:serine hydrolase [Bowmanella pacifica]GGO64320.1 hydrolase [Bowmanella pacifica]
MKKVVVAVILLAVVFVSSPGWLGFGLWRLPAAFDVAAAMGAKLGCSAHFISDFDDERVLADLASYSPVNSLLTLSYTEDGVRAELLGIGRASAHYRPGLGCTLDIDDRQDLDTLKGAQSYVPDENKALMLDIQPDWQKSLQAILQQDNQNGLDTRALLLVKDGQIVAEAYGPGISATTPLLGWSMGKSVTAMLVGRMQALGERATAQEPLFAEWQFDPRADITLEHMLQMTSGLGFDETYAPGTDATKMLFAAHAAAALPLKSPATRSPGEFFAYSSGTTNLLMRYMRNQLGSEQGLQDLLYQQLAAPLGLTHLLIEPDPSGVMVGSSYIYATGRDWAGLGALMLNGGVWQDDVILPADWVARALKPNQSENDDRYGYQFWLNSGAQTEISARRWPELPADAYAMLGNRKQVVMIIPSWNLVFVRLGWSKQEYPVGQNILQLLSTEG